MIALYILAGIAIFLLYLLLDFLVITGNPNAFFDKWVKKTLWLWLPFHALRRLLKEVLEHKK